MENFIFDLDGTLLYTLEDLANACNFTLERYSFPAHPVSAYNRMVGNGFEKLVRRALPENNNLGDDKIQEVILSAKNYYNNHLYDKTVPYPGITEAISYLVKRGKKIGVLSNKPDPMTKEIIDYFFPKTPFSIVQGAKPNLPLKPSPESLLNIMENFSWKPDESCYIGDSDVDIITGKNAGLKTAGVCWGFRGREELDKEQPDYLFEYPSEIIKTFN